MKHDDHCEPGGSSSWGNEPGVRLCWVCRCLYVPRQLGEKVVKKKVLAGGKK